MVLEDTDAADFDPHHVAGLQIFRRIVTDADTGGRPGGDQVTGCKVRPADRVSMMVGMSKISKPVFELCRSSPFT